MTKVVKLPQKRKVAVADLESMDGTQLSKLSTADIERLQTDIAEQIADLNGRNAELQMTLAARYDQALHKERGAKQFGIVKIEDGEFVVEQTIQKKVTWDQAKLEQVEFMLRSEWEERPEEYIKTERKVEERKFTNWPTSIKRLFEPARTVKAGTVKIELKRKESE